MPNIPYHRPRSFDEALQLKSSIEGARYIAGGTDLMVLIKEGFERPAALISLRNIEELRRIEVSDGSVRIGALCTLSEVEQHPALRERFPMLVDAVGTMGSVQIRNCGTIGGNLCHASPCADSAPPLYVLEASAEVGGPEQASRKLNMSELITGPKQTSLGSDDVLRAITIVAQPAGARGVFMRKTRVAMDLTMVNLALWLHSDGDRCLETRMCAGAVGPTPLRLDKVEALLRGEQMSDAIIAQAAALAGESVSPISDIRASAEYRRHIVGVFVERALRSLRQEVAA